MRFVQKNEDEQAKKRNFVSKININPELLHGGVYINALNIRLDLQIM